MLATTGSLFSSKHAACKLYRIGYSVADRQFKVLGLKVKRKLAYSFTLDYHYHKNSAGYNKNGITHAGELTSLSLT